MTNELTVRQSAILRELARLDWQRNKIIEAIVEGRGCLDAQCSMLDVYNDRQKQLSAEWAASHGRDISRDLLAEVV